jgi:hypothetical protein
MSDFLFLITLSLDACISRYWQALGHVILATAQ